ncbi:hypothetical protein [Butyrivibrio fibrisolvens]|uniref:hypothetical protein n=1 Tax=Butyrivibrio fibrisolvens TaxID=831 RepID=UPI0003B579E7|nr:hypothetical protein [Butyrivibrio fibrisolvens]
MKNKVIATFLAIATILTGCSSPVLIGESTNDSQEDLSILDNSVDEVSDTTISSIDYPTAVLGMAPTKAFEEVFMPVAEIIDSYEDDQCLHFFNEVEDILNSLGYEYTYEVDAYDDYDKWIIVKDPDADAEIRIYGHYDEFDNVNVSDEDIRYDLSCIEYQSGSYYGIVDTPNLYNEPCKHGVDDNHAMLESYEYKNISWPENAVTNVDSREDVRRFFFITE